VGASAMVSAIITARMANTRSAKKRVRASLKKRDRNRSTRSAVKTLVSRARRPALPDAASMTGEDVRRAISALDKAAEKGVLHANNASRRKSRLMSALAKLTAGKATPTRTAGKPASAKTAGKPGTATASPSAKKAATKPAKAKA
jgi:small subunit ribosomal protein S20